MSKFQACNAESKSRVKKLKMVLHHGCFIPLRLEEENHPNVQQGEHTSAHFGHLQGNKMQERLALLRFTRAMLSDAL